MNRISARLLLLTGVLILFATTARAQPQYQVTEIPSLNSRLILNQRGDVAGAGVFSGATHPLLYTAADGVRDLGLIPDARFGQPWGVNDRGDVLIGYDMNVGPTRYVVNSGGTTRELALPPSINTLSSLDNAGRVVGAYGSVSPNASGTQPFVLSGDTFTQLPVPSGLQGWAFDSNTAGQVVGARWRVLSIRDGGESVARIWEPNGTVTEIAPPAGWGNTSATLINERGDVLGKLFDGTIEHMTRQSPFVYRDGALMELQNPGWTFMSAGAMNDNGDVAGTFSTALDPARRPFLYSGGQYTDLSQAIPPGYQEPSVSGINDAGQILVSAYDSGFDRHAFLLTPVPEPSAAAGVLSFLAAALLTRRRRAGMAIL